MIGKVMLVSENLVESWWKRMLWMWSFVFCLYNRSEDEGSEETMDTQSQPRTTLSNEVYKQVSLTREVKDGMVFTRLIWDGGWWFEHLTAIHY